MKALILGYGYCGFFLARKLLREGAQVTTVNRHIKSHFDLPGVKHIEADFSNNLSLNEAFDVLYYMAPPHRSGQKDTRLRQCLKMNRLIADSWIYFGSTGVYGNHNDLWVNEDSVCHVEHDRQRRRLDAESCLSHYAHENNTKLLLLRVAGIFGPHRIPIDSVRNKKAIINPVESPWSNLIYINDLINISTSLNQAMNTREVINISDGVPRKMGAMQQALSQIVHGEAPLHTPLSDALANASDMKKEFLLSSKKVSIDKLKKRLGYFKFNDLNTALKESLSFS